jgi:hypothetical protein
MTGENRTKKRDRKVNAKIKTVVLLIALFVFIFSHASLANSAKEKSKASYQDANVLQANRLITHKSIGAVRLGMTIAQARKALHGFTIKFSQDGEGVDLAEVNRGGKLVMTLYVSGEKISERSKIETIRVFDEAYKTADGVRVGISLSEVEKEYGTLKEIIMSEIESREFATFANQPQGIDFQFVSKNGNAGIYAEGERKTIRYEPSAHVESIWITGRGNRTTKFSSAYTDLITQCKNPTPNSEEGGHISNFCKGYGGYFIHIFDSATALQINLESSDRSVSIPIATQSLTYVRRGRKIEWRMADGKPFAIIMRVFKYKGDGEFPFQGKPIGESLLVKGLPGYEHIDYEVEVRPSANANEKARELADEGYLQKTSEVVGNKDKSLQSLAESFIPQGMKLAHKAVEGAFGPSSKNVVVLYGEEKPAMSYKGLVLVPDKDGYKKFALPESEFTWSVEEPKAVFFANADKDSEQELFIIGECYTGIGPTGAQPFYRTRVYDWNGNGFIHLESISKKIGMAATAAEARKKLARTSNTP